MRLQRYGLIRYVAWTAIKKEWKKVYFELTLFTFADV